MDTNGSRMPFFHEAGSQFFIFRVFRVFRGYDCLAIFVCIRVHSWFKNGLSCVSWFPNRLFRGYDCLAIFVCIRVHSWFKNGLSCVSWFPNRYFVAMTVLPLSCAFVVQKWTFVYFVVLLPVLCRGYHPLPYGVEVSVSATRPPMKGLLPSGENLLRVAERQYCA